MLGKPSPPLPGCLSMWYSYHVSVRTALPSRTHLHSKPHHHVVQTTFGDDSAWRAAPTPAMAHCPAGLPPATDLLWAAWPGRAGRLAHQVAASALSNPASFSCPLSFSMAQNLGKKILSSVRL
jgi:hypothetical protein